jgi:hypothetical protein
MRGLKRTTTALAALGVAFALTPVATAQDAGFQLDQAAYDPGQQVTVTATLVSGCENSAVTSPGFKAPIVFSARSGIPRMYNGTGTAADRPGTYTAQATCKGEVVTRTFKINGIAAPPPVKPKPKPPVVKPKGAPQTGGGGTA